MELPYLLMLRLSITALYQLQKCTLFLPASCKIFKIRILTLGIDAVSLLNDSRQFVEHLGYKAYSGGMAFSSNGNLYYGDMEASSILYWNVSASPDHVVNEYLVGDSVIMQWADTFGFDEQGNLLFTSNKLQKFIFGGMQFDGSDGFNFRVWSVPINGDSYLSGNPIPPSLPCRIAN
jgi:hypothetical protein